MSKKFRIWVFSLADLNTCAPRIRLLSPFNCFPKDEFEFVYAPSLNAILRLLYLPDIIVFHRNLYRLQEIDKIIKFARSHRIKTVMEIDDLITHVPVQHSSHYFYQKTKDLMIELFKRVDIITVTNNRLRDYCIEYNPNIRVLPNLIDERIWTAKRRREKPADGKIVVGYSGAPTHAYDFKKVIPALEYISLKYGDKISFKFIGYMPDEMRAIKNVSYTPVICSYQEYADILMDSNLDFAIAPIEDNPHNRCKSNIKYLDYSICGYAGIYSAVGPYLDSITHGETGLLVKNTTEEWIMAMESLINNPELRGRLGRNACQSVTDNYSLSIKSNEWYSLYAQIIASRGNEARKEFSLSPLMSYGPYLIYAQLRGICRKFLEC